MKKIFNWLASFYKAFSGLISVGLLVVFAFVLLLQKCNYNAKERAMSVRLDSLTLANQTLDSAKNKAGQTVMRQVAIVTNLQSDIKNLSEQNFKLSSKLEKKVKEVLAYQSQFSHIKLDSVKVPYIDTVERKRFSDSLEKLCAEPLKYMRDSTITVPAQAKVDSPYYKLDLSVTKEGVFVNNLDIPDSQYFRIVVMKGGFFRKVNGKLKFHVPKKIEFQTLHTNPLVHVTGGNSVIYKENKKPKVLLRAIEAGALIYLGTRL